jgi:hypothetical protein
MLVGARYVDQFGNQGARRKSLHTKHRTNKLVSQGTVTSDTADAIHAQL